MAEKPLKSLKFHGLDDIYKIPSTAEDVGAATLEQVNQAMRKAAPRNLLDNSDFTNPVNQRGETSYNSLGYTIDRWIMPLSKELGVISLANDGVVIDATNNPVTFSQYQDDGLWQRMVNSGKKYTIVMRYTVHSAGEFGFLMERPKGNTINIFPHLDRNPGFHEFVHSFTPSGETGTFPYCCAWLYLKQEWKITIHNIALYEGEYTLDTLPEYQPKGYGAELAECMRYAIAFNFSESILTARVFSSNPRYADVTLYTPGILRRHPDVIDDKVSQCSFHFESEGWLGKIVSATATGNVVNLVFESTNEAGMIGSSIGVCRVIGNLILDAEIK